MKTPGDFCPISKAAEVLGERWTILIIRELLYGTTRYSEFQRGLSLISPSLLTKRLNQLVDCGLVIRRTAPGQPHAEYFPSVASEELRPFVDGLGKWGMKWARGRMIDDELDVQILMHNFCRRIDAAKLPRKRGVIGFIFPRLPKFSAWWIVIEPDRPRELCVDHPAKDIDIQIRTDVRTMTRIWMGNTTIAAAKSEGCLQPSGKPLFVRNLASWLRPSVNASVRLAPEPLRL
ncbi:MAG TPA: helix-turn-helix domain-containing protein [Lacunisphaera sp.]|jgi:DNA-binding HxlR family transcriptional regulator